MFVGCFLYIYKCCHAVNQATLNGDIDKYPVILYCMYCIWWSLHRLHYITGKSTIIKGFMSTKNSHLHSFRNTDKKNSLLERLHTVLTVQIPNCKLLYKYTIVVYKYCLSESVELKDSESCCFLLFWHSSSVWQRLRQWQSGKLNSSVKFLLNSKCETL